MAFKRHAALLTGTALAGSLLFAQPALADETADTVKCHAIVTEEVAKAAPVNRVGTWEITGVEVTGLEGVTVKDASASSVEFVVPTGTEAGKYTANLTGEGTRSETIDFWVSDVEVETEQEIDCAQVEIVDITLTAGEKKDIEVTLPEGASDLKVTAPEGLVVTLDDTTITVDATDAEDDEHKVTFTYQAEGAEEKLTGSFTVTVKKKEEKK